MAARLILGILLSLTTGCASTLTDEERETQEWNRGIDMENWVLCEKILQQHNMYTVHFDHEHTKRSRLRPRNIRSDLMRNQCRYIMGSYWIKY